MKKNSKILITGGSGFIGTNLIDSLSGKYQILNIDISPPINQKQKKFWVELDILDSNHVNKIFNSFIPTHVIHLVAKADLLGKSLDDYKTNTVGLNNIINAIKNCKNIKKTIFASTMLVCKSSYNPKNKRDYCPGTLYGESKKIGEEIIWDSQLLSDWIIIRPTSIWGPWTVKTSFNQFFKMVESGYFFNLSKKKWN